MGCGPSKQSTTATTPAEKKPAPEPTVVATSNTSDPIPTSQDRPTTTQSVPSKKKETVEEANLKRVFKSIDNMALNDVEKKAEEAAAVAPASLAKQPSNNNVSKSTRALAAQALGQSVKDLFQRTSDPAPAQLSELNEVQIVPNAPAEAEPKAE
jgi:hypothetical protein